MPDVLHWLGVTKIHRFISMSDMKYNAIVESGIRIVNRVEIPPDLIPADAQVRSKLIILDFKFCLDFLVFGFFVFL